jgi:hypothetical protein
MSRNEGKSEYRERQEYRESVPRGVGIPHGATYLVVPVLVFVSVWFVAVLFGGWQFAQWWMHDAWNTHPMAVLITNTSCISLACVSVIWKMKVAYDKHMIYVRRAHAEIDIIDEQPYLLRAGSEKGFNSEVEGEIVRVINPKSIAPAGNTENNYFGDDEEEDQDQEDPPIPTLLDQLNAGTTIIDEDTSIVGYVDGEPLRGSLFARSGNLFDSLLAIGDQGFGKSSLGVLIACYTVLHGGKILVVDPDAEEQESLTKRLGALSKFLMGPVANTPEKTLHVVSIAREAIESPSGRPVLWLIDEFSYLMRQVENKDSKWNDAAKQIKELAEDYATRGRKRLCRVIAFGQIAKVERTGGSEFRDSCTLLAFHLKRERAQQILEGDAADITSQLVAGEVVVVPRNAGGQAYKLALPYADAQAVSRVIEMVGIEDRNGTLLGLSGTLGMERDEASTYGSPKTPIWDGEIINVDFDTGLSEKPLNGLPDLLGTGPELSPNDLMMTDLQIIQFEALYKALGNIKDSLRVIEGCNNRHHKHASWLVKQKDLRKF